MRMDKMSDGCGVRIKKARNRKKITLIELAAHLGVSQDYLTVIELGDAQSSQEEVERILAAIENWRKEGPFTGDMKNPEDFKSFRKKCRMTIVELSAITGVSQVLIARFEQEEASLPEETLELLISALENPCGFSKN